MASDVCHFLNQASFGLPLSGGMSIINSAANSSSIYTTNIDKMNASIDGDLQKSPRSPSLKIAPQRPGPSGSRVVRKRSSIPRLGAGLSALFTQISSSSQPVEIPVTNHEPVANVAECLSDRTVSIATINGESSIPAVKNSGQGTSKFISADNKIELKTKQPSIEDDSVPHGSPVSSTEEDTSFASCNSFDGINLSSPNSTPPPSSERVHGRLGPTLTAATVDDHPFRRTSDYPPYQSIPHLADKLTNVIPSHLTNNNNNNNNNNNGGSPTAHLAGTAPHSPSGPTVPVQYYPFLNPMGAQFGQLGGNPTRPKEFDYQNDNGFRVAPQISPKQQSGKVCMAVPSAPYSPNFASNIYSVRESHISFVPPGTYSLPFPHGFTNPPLIQQPILPVKIFSKEHKFLSLEFKLKKYILKDQMSAEINPTGVHIFVDMSNIGIGFMDAVKIAQGLPLSQHLKTPISFENLARILERGRNVQKRVLAGSLAFPASKRENWPPHLREAEKLNYEMNIFDRVQVEKKNFRSKRKNRTPPHRSTLYSPNDITSADESTEDGATAKIITKNGEQGVGKLNNLSLYTT